MAAAEITLTETKRSKLGNLELVTGTCTVSTTLDWVDVGNLTPALKTPVHAHANISTTGVDGEAFVTAASDLVKFTQTGAMQVLILAESAESTGGD